ncbi:MAG: pimeloyl-ACP methyl ester esterase BioH [Gammaproteobacteria bacterium]|nr:pimeloyl-ACP methyl ester esterase BioH [Gammaproteobacteria bacterium]
MTLYRHVRGVGRPLVALHGWGMNSAVWEPLLAGLAEHFQVTVIELPGHGGSPPAVTADLGLWAQMCLDAAPPQAHWIGWSLGGQVAMQAALAAPARFTGLSLLASTPSFVQRPDWPDAMAARVFDQFAGALAADPATTLMRFLGLQVKGAEHARETLRLLREEIGLRPPATLDGLTQGLELLAATDLCDRLGDIDCPTHWLFGSRDTLVPVGVSERIRSILAGASIDIIDGAGHAPFLSHPYECLERLLDVAV